MRKLYGRVNKGGHCSQAKTAVPTGKEFTVLPDNGYDCLSSVIVAGDANLVPINIVSGVTIYGVTGIRSVGGVDVEDTPELCEVHLNTDGWATQVGYMGSDGMGGSSFLTSYLSSENVFSVNKGSLLIVGTEDWGDGYTTVENTDTDGFSNYCGKVGTADVFYIGCDCTIWDGYY